MTRPTYDVFIIGDYFFDQIYAGLPQFPELGRETYSTDIVTTGGALYITATALHRLDVKVGWPVYFGNDYYSRSIRDLALIEGLDLSLEKRVDRPYRRVTTSIPYAGERAFLTFVDPLPDDLHAHWLSSMERSDFAHLHVGGLMPLDVLMPMLELARSRGATISIDCQDDPLLYAGCEFQQLLSMVDVVMPNLREALIMTRKETLEDAIQQLMSWVEVVLVKDGSRGAWYGSRGEVGHVEGVHAGDAVDTTGAGDCFNAGFLRGYVVEKAPVAVSVRYGNVCGGLSVTGIGGATTVPTYRELMCWFRDNRPCRD